MIQLRGKKMRGDKLCARKSAKLVPRNRAFGNSGDLANSAAKSSKRPSRIGARTLLLTGGRK